MLWVNHESPSMLKCQLVLGFMDAWRMPDIASGIYFVPSKIMAPQSRTIYVQDI